MVADKTYDNVVKGGLKIKGKVISKNKKVAKADDSRPRDVIFLQEPKFETKAVPKDDLEAQIQQVISNPALTNSEKSFRIAQIKRHNKQIEELLKESHQERVEKFNKKLSKLSEHFDIPKVGPG
ncbi:hypothetical protein BgAZ_102050 [Babesia gibsoni]|uniref:Uncharacterized protein n=1 Tax=Babesia gibsoni TaxID=33632 RepID=A0AAD8UVE4_BABGI|nr:hypothetical protein BgAZ_102050 [Babesia gibsoni]